MPRASPGTRPTTHDCCPNAVKYLRTASFVGEWRWLVQTPGAMPYRIPISHCPWCGVRLPDVRF